MGVNAEDASRTTMEQLLEYAQLAKEHGADRIRYCDTLGYDDPLTVHDRVYELAKAVRLPIELHCHNDLGMVVAVSVAGAMGAVDAGQDAYINTCVNGMGERAGNCDLVSAILAVKKASGWAPRGLLDPRVDLSKAWQIAIRVIGPRVDQVEAVAHLLIDSGGTVRGDLIHELLDEMEAA